jgi:DNA-binding transcriptional ArsR family regulator
VPTEPTDERLDQIFDALANPHRRDIIRFLGLQPAAISELARQRGLSLPAINKHIGILERSGLVERRKIGRTTYLTLRRQPLGLLQGWVEQFHPYWGHDDASYENYFDHLARTDTPSPTNAKPTTTKGPTP